MSNLTVAKDLPFCRFKFTLLPRERLYLPLGDSGTIWRGAFGILFRKLVCIFPHYQRCTTCEIQRNCAYGIVFETSPPPDAAALSRNLNIPRPFVIHPPTDAKDAYEPGEEMGFHVTLVGTARQYWPFVFLAIQALGEEGVGPARARFAIKHVALENPATGEKKDVYEYERHVLKNESLIVTTAELAEHFPYHPERHYALEFISPTVIKADDSIVSRPLFSEIVKRLRDRANALGTFFADGPVIDNPVELAERAASVESDSRGIFWEDRSRYSTRTKTRHKTGGFMGIMRLTGDLSPFWPLLLLGQYINVGKQTTFGNGRFRLMRSETV